MCVKYVYGTVRARVLVLDPALGDQCQGSACDKMKAVVWNFRVREGVPGGRLLEGPVWDWIALCWPNVEFFCGPITGPVSLPGGRGWMNPSPEETPSDVTCAHGMQRKPFSCHFSSGLGCQSRNGWHISKEIHWGSTVLPQWKGTKVPFILDAAQASLLWLNGWWWGFSWYILGYSIFITFIFMDFMDQIYDWQLV